MKYERKALQLLRRLGVNSSYLGFRYTACAVALNIQNPDLIIYISKGLYVEVAARYNTSISCVERDIRTIVEAIWARGNRRLLIQILGTEQDKKPRNASFIDAISQYLIEHPAWKPNL